MSSELPPDVVIERVFLVEAKYTPEAPKRRPAWRPFHVERIARLRDQGIIIEAGGLFDFSSAFLLIRAADEEGALDVVRNDVYTEHGVWGPFTARAYGRVCRPSELPSS